MNAANWTSDDLQLFECSDYGVDLTLTPNFFFKSVDCSLFSLWSVFSGLHAEELKVRTCMGAQEIGHTYIPVQPIKKLGPQIAARATANRIKYTFFITFCFQDFLLGYVFQMW